VGPSLVAVAALGVVVGCCVAAAVVVSRCGSLHVSSFSVAVAFSVSVSCLSSGSYSVPAIPCSPVRPIVPVSSLPVAVPCSLSGAEVRSERVFRDVDIFVKSVLRGCMLEVGCASPVDDSRSCH
jgi:hypothetical protein